MSNLFFCIFLPPRNDLEYKINSRLFISPKFIMQFGESIEPVSSREDKWSQRRRKSLPGLDSNSRRCGSVFSHDGAAGLCVQAREKR